MEKSQQKFCGVAGIGIVLLLLCTASAWAQVNAVYLQSNDPTANTVLGYSNDGAGNLTALPGSPYSTSGTGWPGPLALQQDDDGQVITNSAGTLLFAVNGHSNTVADFTINADGSLSLITTLDAAGSQPASLGLFENVLSNGSSLLVIADKSSDTSHSQKIPAIVSFTVDASGNMTQNKTSKFALATGESPSQVVVQTASKLVFLDRFMSSPSSISSFRIRSNGAFRLLGTVNVPTGDNVFLGMALNPVADYLYAALPVDNQIAVYSFSRGTGLLTFVTTVPNFGGLACWITTDAAGTRLYSAETMTGTITTYDITNPALPVQLQQINLSTTNDATPAPWNVKVDPTGTFLYAVSNQALHVINIQSDGTLNETAAPVALPVSSSDHPYGLATALR
jgi:6-phosphogluconolactonase (cycloisomerase 2 family)